MVMPIAMRMTSPKRMRQGNLICQRVCVSLDGMPQPRGGLREKLLKNLRICANSTRKHARK